MIMKYYRIYVLDQFHCKLISRGILSSILHNFLILIFFSSKGKLYAQWYVTRASRDIADFYVNIRDSNSNIKYEKYLPYDTRLITIDANDIPQNNDDNPLQFCVMGKSSSGIINGWYEAQCKDLPRNFDNVKKVYNEKYNSAFVVLSTDKRIKVSKSAATSSLANLSILVILLTIFNIF